MKKYIMSIDQGTTSSRVVFMDHVGSLVATGSCEFKQYYPKAGWVEHNAEDIWDSVLTSADRALENLKKYHSSKSLDQAFEVIAVGITNQRETVVPLQKSTGKALHNAIVWQCRRTADMCQKMKKTFEKKIKSKTGLVLDPYFSASKMRWLIENVPAIKKAADADDLLFTTIDSFLIWKLTQGKVAATDVSNASRTMLMNLKTGKWDKDLLKIFKVPASALPEILPSAGVFGEVKGFRSFVDGSPITGVAGDQQAALFGQACFGIGDSKCTFGTGSFILMNTGSQILSSKAGLLTTVAWQIAGEKIQYALEGGAFICGAAVGWLRDGLGIIQKSSEVESLAATVSDTDGVEFVPALAGLGAPHWNAYARGEITGLTRGTTKAHIARATLESMALQNSDILLAMQKDLKKKMKRLRVDGGAAANSLLMQIQSDYLAAPVDRPVQIETTALGAGYLAGIGVGHWRSTAEIQKIWLRDKEFTPQMKATDLKKRRDRWNRAIQKTKMTYV